jgi:hypothetical protein
MADPFAKPTLPQASNVHGLPRPPSGTHPATSPPIVVKPATSHTPSDTPAPNIHKAQAGPYVGRASHLGRLASLVRRSDNYDLLDSVR